MTLALVAAVNLNTWLGAAPDDSVLPLWIERARTVDLLRVTARGGRLRTRSAWLDAVSVFLPASAARRFARRRLAPVARGRVQQVSAVAPAPPAPQDYNYGPNASDQITLLSVDKVHAEGYVGTGVPLAILDTGYDLGHPALRHLTGSGRVLAQHDFISGDSLLTDAGAVPLPTAMNPLGGVLYVSSADLAVSGANAFAAYSVASEENLAGTGVNRWSLWVVRGTVAGNSVSWGAPDSLPLSTYALNPSAAAVADTLKLVYQAHDGLRFRVKYARYVGSAVSDTATLDAAAADCIAPDIVALGDTLVAAWYEEGNGVVGARSTDGGATWGAPALVAATSDFGGLSLSAVGDTAALYFSDGQSLWFGRLAGSWTTSLLGNGLAPASEPSAPYPRLVFVADSSYVYASAPSTSGAFTTRAAAFSSFPSPPAMGSYAGTVALAVGTASGAVALVDTSGAALDTVGSAFSQPLAVASGRALFRRRGDDVADSPPLGGGKYHGTRMASVIAGLSEGSLVGTAPGASLILGKTERVSPSYSTAPFENTVEEDFWVEGLEWAARAGARVLSSSLGYRDWYSAADMDGKTSHASRAASTALARNVLVVNAMGNLAGARVLPDPAVGDTTLVTPADADGIVAVSGFVVDTIGGRRLIPSAFSSFGPSGDGRQKPEVIAPFEAWAASDTVFFGETDTTFYLMFSGTSFSTALVAGLAADVLQGHPSWSATALRDAILAGCDQLDGYATPNYLTGYGVPNAYTILYSEPPEVVPPTGDALDDPFPNPFNPTRDGSVTVPFTLLHRSSIISLRVYTLSGELVKKIELRDAAPGGAQEAFTWDGRGRSGSLVAPGLYLLLLKTAYGNSTAKLLVTR